MLRIARSPGDERNTIDLTGKVAVIYPYAKPEEHPQEILGDLDQLGIKAAG